MIYFNYLFSTAFVYDDCFRPHFGLISMTFFGLLCFASSRCLLVLAAVVLVDLAVVLVSA